MKNTVNSYFAVLLITIAAATATSIIVNVVYDNNFSATMRGSEASYSALQDSILAE